MEEKFHLRAPFLINEVFAEPEHSINIPSYIMRGAGKQTHVEYEIRIFLADDRWLLLRRFSRFRELHLNMKALYGDMVNYIFPASNLTRLATLFTSPDRKNLVPKASIVCIKQRKCRQVTTSSAGNLSSSTARHLLAYPIESDLRRRERSRADEKVAHRVVELL